MSQEHPKGRRWTITIIRKDGTHWAKDSVKHLIVKVGFVVLYEGEHNKDRRETWIPVEQIDHFTIEEGK